MFTRYTRALAQVANAPAARRTFHSSGAFGQKGADGGGAEWARDRSGLPIEGRTYRHYTGNDYVVVGTAIHTETQQLMVIYRRARICEAWQLFVRPASMWRQVVTAPCGAAVPRFRAWDATGAESTDRND